MFPLVPYSAFTKFTPSIPAFYQNAYSSEEVLKKILFELCKLADYANDLAKALNELDGEDDQLALRIRELQRRVDAIAAMLDGLKVGGRSRNPVSGGFDYMYTIFKQMYDTLRVHAMTWRQLANTGHTWQELANDGKTYIEVDMISNDIWGDGSEQIKYTDPDRIDNRTPGYVEVI